MSAEPGPIWARWWTSADDASSARVLALVFLPWLLHVLLMLVGIDRMTVLEPKFLVTGWAVPVALLPALRGWFGPSALIQSRRPLGWLRRDRIGAWVLVGIGVSTLSALVFAVGITGLRGTLAQHAEGPVLEATGVITSSSRDWRSACGRDVTLRLDGEPADVWICIRIRNSWQVADYLPQAGDRIRVTMRTTPYGRVALRLTMADPRLRISLRGAGADPFPALKAGL